MKETSKGKVLVVDDSRPVVLMIKSMLEEEAYNVITAFSGEEGMEKAIEEMPDVILLDVMMPGIDGFETCRRLKDNSKTMDIPVLMVTAVNDTASKVSGLKSGCCDYVTKPFNVLELLARVNSQMRIKMLHDELKSKNDELVKTYNHLKETQSQMVQMAKLSALGEMIAGVAHELNNPLTGIIGYTELLLSSEAAEKFRRQIQKIYKQADRCRKIIQNLMIFSREQSSEKVICSLNKILQEVLEIINYQLTSDGVKIYKDFACDLPEMLLDRNQLQQVFLNMLNNSHQAMDNIRGEKSITIRSYREGTLAKVEIRDTGRGIPSENLDKIFDPFFTTKSVGEGTGLGLSICYGIIKDHGGQIKVESTPGKGTAFTVEIPMTSYKPVTEKKEIVKSVTEDVIKNILVIDDEEVIREVVTSALENLGHSVDSFNDGQVALEKIKSKSYDLILTDIKMPGIDGKVFFEFIKEYNPDMAEKVLFMSGDILGLPGDSFLQKFKDRLIEKPFTILHLQERVKAFFS